MRHFFCCSHPPLSSSSLPIMSMQLCPIKMNTQQRSSGPSWHFNLGRHKSGSTVKKKGNYFLLSQPPVIWPTLSSPILPSLSVRHFYQRPGSQAMSFLLFSKLWFLLIILVEANVLKSKILHILAPHVPGVMRRPAQELDNSSIHENANVA